MHIRLNDDYFSFSDILINRKIERIFVLAYTRARGTEARRVYLSYILFAENQSLDFLSRIN